MKTLFGSEVGSVNLFFFREILSGRLAGQVNFEMTVVRVTKDNFREQMKHCETHAIPKCEGSRERTGNVFEFRYWIPASLNLLKELGWVDENQTGG